MNCTRPGLLRYDRPLIACRAMPEVRVVKDIPAARQAVWDVYTDHVSWNDWAGIGRVRLEREGRPRNGVGCVRVISAGGISAREEVLSFDPPVRMTYRVLQGGLPIRNHHGEVLFEDGASGGTTVTWQCRFDSRVPGLGWLWKLIVTRVFRTTLQGLCDGPFGRRQQGT
jgi:uncharacterized protein YndB with AHSA1/START domain